LEDQSYFVEYEGATAIGKCSKNLPPSANSMKMEMIDKLKNLVDTTQTFQNLLAQGSINGLKEFSKDNNMDTVDKIANFLIEKSKDKNEYYIKFTATSALGKFLVTKNEETNERLFSRLIELLRDKRQTVKENTCTALADPDAKPTKPNSRVIRSINELTYVAGHDLDGFVRRVAENSLKIIREWIKEWAEKPSKIDVKMREEKQEEKHIEMAVEKKQDEEKRLETIRRPIIEY
jgi:hypothetical protein